MAKVLSFPFRIAAFGGAVTIEQGSDTYYSEQVAVLLLTNNNERLLHKNFGMPDIPFRGFPFSTFQQQVSRELPEIADLAASMVEVDQQSQTISVDFSMLREVQ